MHKEEIILTENEGAIIIRDEGIPEIYAPIGVGDMCDNIRFTLAFILYAVEKEDWVGEFQEFVNTLENNMKEDSVKHKRSKFKVIDGEKSE
jgi:hypothetical protein